MKTMKVLEFHKRIKKIIKNHGIPSENYENHENLRIPAEKKLKS